MAEEQDEVGSGSSGPQSGGAGSDPAAVVLGLASASREKADAFLDDQRRLTALQIDRLEAQDKHFREEAELELTHLRWRTFNDRMKGALQIMTVLVGLAVVGGLGVMVWNAAHADGYVIESFEVPPELAARGLTGEVAAARLLDRLNVVQTPVINSVSAAQTLATSISDNVKVEIPETGISLGELYRFLRRWLGHEIHVSGEVVRQDRNLAVAVRINGKDGASYQGAETDLDSLLQKAAEHVFETVQPPRYSTWLRSQTPSRDDEANAVLERVISDPEATPRFRSSAWMLLGNRAGRVGDYRRSMTLLRHAQETDPTSPLAFTNAIFNQGSLSHPEAMLTQLPQAVEVFEKHHDYFAPRAVTSLRAGLHAFEAELRGDYLLGIAEYRAVIKSSGNGSRNYTTIRNIAFDRAHLHDGGTIAWLAEQPQPAQWAKLNPQSVLELLLQSEAGLQHWPRVLAIGAEAERASATVGLSQTGRETWAALRVRPLYALAKAKTGDSAGAEGVISRTPGDCYDCVRIRGQIASEAKAWGRADYWFAKAVADAPSIPMAHEDWGRSLLARGKPGDAIAQFTIGNQKGPHFADPFEGWGEALMAKNQSHLGLAKFKDAEKYAPNWGRLHLKWGEALVYAGKKDEAKKQFARAAQLDLTPSEKAELTQFGDRHE